MTARDFISDSVQLMYYKCHKVKFRHGHSYIDSKKEVGKCFQYMVMVALNYGETESHLERVSNIKPFINKYN